MNSRFRSTVIVSALTALCLAAVSRTCGADGPPRPRLNKIDAAQLWKAVSPALAEGRKPELLEQLVAVFTDPSPGSPANGWYHESQSRYGWSWLARELDSNRDDKIAPEELAPLRQPRLMQTFDRDSNSILTADDFNWSSQSTLNRQARQVSSRFNSLDVDSNGQISPEEWQKAFATLSKKKAYVSADDLGELFAPPAERPRLKYTFLQRWDRAKVILNGDIGSMFEGPRLNGPAPDFALGTHDGLQTMRLSENFGKRPIVLIFGSFT
jgi:Ca2+-binding EF-hand superfamily protein